MGTDGELCEKLAKRWSKGKINRQPLTGYLVRNLQIGNDESWSWRPWCVLPNLNGQKYTLGESFTSRETQGEFIFLREPATDGKIEIHVENEKYFVTPLDKDREVLINDVKIVSKTELKFGDYLVLGDKCKELLFAERRFYTSDKAKCKGDQWKKKIKADVEFTALHNGLILSQIFSYLPVDDVKGCRLVTRLWNQEALKFVKKRCQVKFDFEPGYHKPHQSMKIFRHDIEMADVQMTNWVFNYPSFKNFDTEQLSSGGQPFANFFEDFNSFLSKPYIPNIKQIEVGGAIRSKQEFDLRSKLLEAVQGKLLNLTISGRWYVNEEEGGDFDFPTTINFPNLRSFTMSLTVMGYTNKDYSDLNWFDNFVHGITSVTSIHLLCDCDPDLVLKCLKTINEVSSTFSYLEELSVCDLNPDMVNILLQLKLNKPLKKLKLVEAFMYHTKEDVAAFEQLLKKYAASLEKFTFTMPQKESKDKDLPLFMRFPAFPNLQYLKISWEDNYVKNKGVGLNFPGGDINYEKDFPSLISLVLGPSYGFPAKGRSHYGTVYEAFFPPIKANPIDKQATEICHSVQVLDIWGEEPWLLGDEIDCFFTKPKIVLMTAMFPNASNYDWIRMSKKCAISDSGPGLSEPDSDWPELDSCSTDNLEELEWTSDESEMENDRNSNSDNSFHSEMESDWNSDNSSSESE